ncbi:MAG: energy-coupling factor transporter transmembrane component T [Anaerolineae bacterium]|nr:energy-coupling factor transporter transmembrane component T [Anaerolineae bacterium]
MIDARAMLVWLFSLMVSASFNRNPLYSILLFMIALWVHDTCASADQRDMLPLAPLRFALVAVPVSAIFNGLFTHVGDTVLFTLPLQLPLVGGPISVESLIYGLVNGLSLAIIFTGFAAFNRAIPVRDLIRLTPRAFYESGIVVSIALTFVPQTVRNLARIREAQAVRGHRLKGLRDWLPIFTPLLVGSLERALALAESLVSRGYVTQGGTSTMKSRWLLFMGMLVVSGGWVVSLFIPSSGLFGTGLLLLGSLFFVLAIWLPGRVAKHSTYRQASWGLFDSLVIIGTLPVIGVAILNRQLLDYNPYPAVTWPGFDILVGFCLVTLLVPVFIQQEKTG